MLVLGLAITLSSASAALETVEEVRECTRGNFPERNSLQTIELVARDRAGGERTLDARLHWKRGKERSARIMIRVDRPSDLRGSSYLLIEKRGRDDMFMYLPAMQKVRRISAGMLSGQLWGTDFSYEDVKQLQGIAADGETERLPDARIAGRSTYVLSLVPDSNEESSYRRIVSYVDQETCVPLKIEFYERGDRLRKLLLADPDRVDQVDGRWIARELEMRDVRDETQTWLRTGKVVHDGKISDRSFDPGRFYLGR
jgi:hypothetical protein